MGPGSNVLYMYANAGSAAVYAFDLGRQGPSFWPRRFTRRQNVFHAFFNILKRPAFPSPVSTVRSSEPIGLRM